MPLKFETASQRGKLNLEKTALLKKLAQSNFDVGATPAVESLCM